MNNQMNMMQLEPSAKAILIEQTERSLPDECCGVLAGIGFLDKNARISSVIPLANNVISPNQLLGISRSLRQQGLDVMGFYHSHPHGIAEPSRKDIAASTAWHGYYHIILASSGPGKTSINAYTTDKPSWNQILLKEAKS
jgi:proteasome lid subunit RPN8/RPN11